MDLHQKIRTLPTQPGCYLYKNAEGEVIYVGKAKNLRARVRSYFLEASQANAKTGSLMREAVDVEYITVANEHEALALENNLDLAIARYNIPIAQADILRTQAGGSFRGVNTGVVQNTPGGGVGGFGTGGPGAGAGGTSGGAGGAGRLT